MRRLFSIVLAVVMLANPCFAAGRSSHAQNHARLQRLHRSAAAKHEFWRESGHPHGWPGHIVDHIVPLACGGADAQTNMQWEAVAEPKAKDKWERRGCKR
jgi:5-methylcytosine-specific restriction endonuclease McrA